jgi:hypothetical protein
MMQDFKLPSLVAHGHGGAGGASDSEEPGTQSLAVLFCEELELLSGFKWSCY